MSKLYNELSAKSGSNPVGVVTGRKRLKFESEMSDQSDQ